MTCSVDHMLITLLRVSHVSDDEKGDQSAYVSLMCQAPVFRQPGTPGVLKLKHGTASF